ncbi:hypothetical protein [Streptomyces axinellae]|uniref:Uncharacterized protein n=1 Tax=Streptomyces axinellae TaxID=552788 RepID=A0ABN3PSG5_9ACTN
MGWTVLYIAFGIVALWLLGEVLLQYKARLRYRLLAFVGFLGVVVGAVIPSVIVIGIGIAAFATGQTYVTLSYRRGFSTGWALGGRPGSSRRRRPSGAAPKADPSLEVSDLQAHDPGAAPVPDPSDDHGSAGYQAEGQYTPEPQGYGASAVEETQVYGMSAVEETQVYGMSAVEETQAYAYADSAETQAPYQDPQQDSSSYQDPSAYQDSSQGPTPYAAEAAQQYAQAETQQYAPYADPYLGYDHQGEPAPPPAGAQQQQPSYDYGYGDYGSGDYADSGLGTGGLGSAGYDGGDYNSGGDPNSGYGGGDNSAGPGEGYGGYGYPGQDQLAPQPPYYTDLPDTPPGGVWVPQQRDTDAPPPDADQQPPGSYGYPDETYQQYPQGYYNDRHGTY